MSFTVKSNAESAVALAAMTAVANSALLPASPNTVPQWDQVFRKPQKEGQKEGQAVQA